MRPFKPSIRWRLAAISAALTFAILCVFAIAVGQLTSSRIKSDFDNELAVSADRFTDRLRIKSFDADTGQYRVNTPDLSVFASPDVTVRVLDFSGRTLAETRNAPEFPIDTGRSSRIGGFRVETRRRGIESQNTGFSIPLIVQYGRKSSDLDATIARVRLFLILGVLAGTAFALIAGLLLASRAMAPIARLTEAAREITRTRDPNREVPQPDTDDEVAELAATMDEMLKGLASSRAEAEDMLLRQRQFVADASHELRTPLTSVLANLELLTAELDGERREAAESALRSSRRMRRLVADLLLLARADAKREAPRYPTDVGRVLVDVAAELGPVTDGHLLEIDARESIVDGSPDELHRLVLNLVENAIHHTPAGTEVRASSGVSNGSVVLSVEDDGPGIDEAVRKNLFERFVRAGDDHAGSFGLGLSIVKAVAESHGGSVTFERPEAGGTRFVVTLPRASETDVDQSSARIP